MGAGQHRARPPGPLRDGRPGRPRAAAGGAVTLTGAAAALRSALHRSGSGTDDELLLPERLARACLLALPVDGAGLTLVLLAGRRVPLGASDPEAGRAERLQFVLGDGPCTAAHRDSAPVLAGAAELLTRWPVFAGELARQTSYRSAAALPVGGALADLVVLDLYWRAGGLPDAPALADAGSVAGVVGEELTAGLAGSTDTVLGVPAELRTPAVRARQQVWVAVGRLAVRDGTSSGTALAVLRARAFLDDSDLETTARRVLAEDGPPA